MGETEAGKEKWLEPTDGGVWTSSQGECRAMEILSREVAVEVLTLATPLSASEEMGHDGKVGRPLEAMTVMRQEEMVAQVRGAH